MSKNRTGNFIAGGKPQVPSLTSNNGVFDITENYSAVNNTTWQTAGSGYYEINRSLRFRASVVTTLTKTFSSTSSFGSQKFTYSFWVKKGLHNANMQIFSSAGANHPGGADISTIVFNSDEIQFYHYPNGGSGTWLVKSHALRDHSAWYHVVLSCDTTQTVPSNRAKMWINGVQHVKSDNTYPAQNGTTYYFSTRQQMWGQEDGRFRYPFDGHLAELHAIDGQALDETYFGYFDPITNIWQPKRYTGTYGLNGYYLPFTENQSTLNLGRNFSGSNYFTYSEQFDNGAWSKYQSSVTANATTAPDGTTTADKLVGTTGTSGDHQVNQSGMVTAVNNGVYTLSCYAKAAERSIFRLYILKRDGATYAYSDFNLTTGQIDHTQAGPFAGAIPTITSVGNGWYRCAITVDIGSGAGGVNAIISYASATGETAGWGLFIWGAQFNLGTTVDPYIQTVASNRNTDWTPNNFSLTAGTSYDSMVDSPTNVFTTATDIGGVVSGNYATLNPLATGNVIPPTGANLNLTLNAGSNTYWSAIGTIPITSGKWYWECICQRDQNAGQWVQFGIVSDTTTITNNPVGFSGNMSQGYAYYNDGAKAGNGTATGGYGATFNNNDVIGVAFDDDNGTITFYKNGVSQGVAFTGISTALTWLPIIQIYRSTATNQFAWINFGQRPFAYAPPAGFKSLNSTNLQALGSSTAGRAAINPSNYFDTILYTGTATNPRTVSGYKFAPDFLWIKRRNAVENHQVVDSVRGTPLTIFTNATNADTIYSANIMALTPNGFTLGNDSNTNVAGGSFVAWAWNAGNSTKGGIETTNTSGSVTSTLRVSSDAGISIATYAAPNNGSFTFGHGLGSTPRFFMLKERGAASNWIVWHSVFGSPTNQGLYLNGSGSPFAAGANWLTGVTSTTIGITQGQVTSGAQNHIVYSFIEVPGFSKIGSFTGNGSTDGPFVYCGFRPAFIMAKSFTNGAFWVIHDTKRDLANPSTRHLYANNTNAEEQLYSSFDILSNGFKCRNANDNVNYSGSTAVYIAFAESPFALNNRAR